MLKRVLLGIGIFVLVLGTGAGIAKAARPDRPVYATVEQVEQMIADATATINTAITNLTSRVATLEGSIPSSQPTYPTDLIIITDPGWNVSTNNLEVRTYLTSSTQKDNTSKLMYANVWGIAHTSSEDIVGRIEMFSNEVYQLNFHMSYLSTIPTGTQIPVDIYGSYGGQTVKTTITVTKDF